MDYEAVGNRIAVDFSSLHLPISKKRALDILNKENVKFIDVNICALAKKLVGTSEWKYGARQEEAPNFFDCSGLTKWLYGQKGIWIPRRSQQQFDFCVTAISIYELSEITPGDLIFLNSPFKSGVKVDSNEEVGHVCIASSAGQAVCATNSEFGKGVVELPIATLLGTRKFQGAGRVIPSEADVMTLVFPPEGEIETTDDILSIVQGGL
jgi:cell wall-associated NlpC family hydrolase